MGPCSFWYLGEERVSEGLERCLEGVRWCFEDDRIRLQHEMSTYQSWNCASASPSFGCMVTYKMPGVALDAIAKANFDD